MQRYNQRMVEQLKVRQQQEKARLPKIQRSEGKTRMAMYKKSLHISGAGSAAEQREKVKQVGALVRRSGHRPRCGGACPEPGWDTHTVEDAAEGPGRKCASHRPEASQTSPQPLSGGQRMSGSALSHSVPSPCGASTLPLPRPLNPFLSPTETLLARHHAGSGTGVASAIPARHTRCPHDAPCRVPTSLASGGWVSAQGEDLQRGAQSEWCGIPVPLMGQGRLRRAPSPAQPSPGP